MARWSCLGCGCMYAPGAPCCPECRGTDYEEEAGVPKITVHDGPSYGPDPSAVAEPEVPEAAAPDPTQDPGLDQGSTPPPSSPVSSDLSDGPEAAAEAVDPEAAAEAAEVEAAPKAKPAPSLSRAKTAPEE